MTVCSVPLASAGRNVTLPREPNVASAASVPAAGAALTFTVNGFSSRTPDAIVICTLTGCAPPFSFTVCPNTMLITAASASRIAAVAVAVTGSKL